MARKMTEWPSKRGPITKIMPSNGCIGDTVPLAVGKWYDFHEFGWYMGNVGLNLYLDLPRRGIGVAFIHTPPDQTHGFRMGFRSSDDHVRDINTVIRYLRKELKLPIWLAGHSSGSISVGNVAIHTTERIDGVVFSAPDLLYSGTMGEPSVTHMDLERINVPVLTIAHKLDACRLQHGGSMPRAAAKIVAMAKNAPAKKVVLIEGGVGGTGNPCTSGYHMYDGAKSKVVDAVAIFVLQNTNTRVAK